MSARELSPLSRLCSLAVTTWIVLQPAQLRAQTLQSSQTEVGAIATPAPVCALLQKHLRWHEPFFGLSTWQQVAAEAVAHASPACRAAIAAEKAPEVALALRELEQHAAAGGPSLRQFRERVLCTLRVPEARQQILAGVLQPATYAECADALFAMQWSEPEAQKLRARYLEGLRQEPLSTHLPRSILQPLYADQLVPLLRAYDHAQRPGRDAIYQVICGLGTKATAQTQTLCTGPAEREPEWIAQKLLHGDIEDGFRRLAAMPPEQLPQFTWLLQKFNAEQRPGRDRFYGLLCLRYSPQSTELGTSCLELQPWQEALWAARDHAQSVTREREEYNHGGRVMAGGFFGVSLLLAIQFLLAARQRRLPPV